MQRLRWWARLAPARMLWRLLGRKPGWAMRPCSLPVLCSRAAVIAAREASPMTVHVHRGKDGQWYWRAVARNGRTRADGGEGYTRRSSAVRAAKGFFRDVRAATIKIVVE
jgi:uncharacterized protein YegP (UPF0339 family)